MKTTDQKAVLMERIIALEHKQRQDLEVLKKQFSTTFDGLKPFSLVKNIIQDIVTLPGVKNEMLAGAVNLATNYLSKKISVTSKNKTIPKILGNLLKFFIEK